MQLQHYFDKCVAAYPQINDDASEAIDAVKLADGMLVFVLCTLRNGAANLVEAGQNRRTMVYFGPGLKTGSHGERLGKGPAVG